jgi:hypothetical protein
VADAVAALDARGYGPFLFVPELAYILSAVAVAVGFGLVAGGGGG